MDAAIAGKVDCLVGIPVQVLAMACTENGSRLAGQLRTVLLSTDHVPDALVRRIAAAWTCRVFKHYGMTEMGLGGAVECAALAGYHLRACDLLVEIVDPSTGVPLPDGQAGEIVMTTLTRRGMPLIRYRTGDLAVFRSEACPCQTVLKTLAAVRGRMTGAFFVGGQRLHMAELDEALFASDAILDFSVRLDAPLGADRLVIGVRRRRGTTFETVAAAVRAALLGVPAIHGAVASRNLTLHIQPEEDPPAVSPGTIKRRIHDQRERTRTHAHHL